MTSRETAFIDSYACPRCGVELETRFDVWQGWQRCPQCRALALPPLPAVRDNPAARDPWAASASEDGAGMITAATTVDVGSGEITGPDVPGPAAHISPARLVFRTGLVVSLALALIFFLDRRMTNAVIFSSLAAGFFGLLIRKPGRSH